MESLLVPSVVFDTDHSHSSRSLYTADTGSNQLWRPLWEVLLPRSDLLILITLTVKVASDARQILWGCGGGDGKCPFLAPIF